VKINLFNFRWLALLLVGLSGLSLAGCATTESDNQSARPWNSPHSWESGLPAGVLNQR